MTGEISGQQRKLWPALTAVLENDGVGDAWRDGTLDGCGPEVGRPEGKEGDDGGR